MRWTVSEGDWQCGGCGDPIPPNQPIALLTSRNLIRCRQCAAAMGYQVDAVEVDHERFRIERDRARGQGPARPPTARSTSRRPPSRLTPASEIGDAVFDSKAAAAGRDE